jgi:hypothetical protein
MKNFDEISLDILVALIVVVIFETFILHYISDDKNQVDVIVDKTIIYDTESVTKTELKEILKETSVKKIKLMDVFKSSLSGIVRGGLTGLLVHGFEGCVTGAVVMGVINPFTFFIENSI